MATGRANSRGRELLLDVRHRGLTIDPELAIADGGLGFWGALRKVFPQTREQRCWVHKTANVLNKLPKGVQPKAKAMLHDIWMAETQAAADHAFDLFVATFAAKFPAATTCLVKDRDVLLTFLRFSGRTLDSHPDHEPRRVDVRHRPVTHEEDKGRRQPVGVLDDGIQAGDGRAEAMESVERVSADRRCHRRCALRRWPQKGSRLITCHTQHLAISLFAVGVIRRLPAALLRGPDPSAPVDEDHTRPHPRQELHTVQMTSPTFRHVQQFIGRQQPRLKPMETVGASAERIQSGA